MNGDVLAVESLEDLGPVIGLPAGARVYERGSGSLVQWNGEGEGWSPVPGGRPFAHPRRGLLVRRAL